MDLEASSARRVCHRSGPRRAAAFDQHLLQHHNRDLRSCIGGRGHVLVSSTAPRIARPQLQQLARSLSRGILFVQVPPGGFGASKEVPLATCSLTYKIALPSRRGVPRVQATADRRRRERRTSWRCALARVAHALLSCVQHPCDNALVTPHTVHRQTE